MEIYNEFATSQWVDVGIDPYAESEGTKAYE